MRPLILLLVILMPRELPCILVFAAALELAYAFIALVKAALAALAAHLLASLTRLEAETLRRACLPPRSCAT